MVAALTWDEFVRYADAPARLVFLAVLGVIARLFVHRLIDQLVGKASGVEPAGQFFGSQRAAKLIGNRTLYHERRAQRANALGSLLKSVSTATIAVVIVLMMLATLGFPLSPILASAGVFGVALGLGAQGIVKDLIAGVSMLLEDQYGVGDVIDMGVATGTVEGVALRVTRVRAGDGVLWHVRNGEIQRVGNMSQGWSSLQLDIAVSYDESVPRVEGLINDVAHRLAGEEAWRDRVLEVPRVIGIEDVKDSAITVRLVGRCKPNEHAAVQRELRMRLKDVFDTENIRMLAPT